MCSGSNPTGRWVSGGATSVNGIHSAMMPNGQVLIFSYNHKEHFYDQEGGYQYWDPVSRTAGPMQSYSKFNPFCAGQCFLGDGRLFVAGGYVSGDPFRASAANNVQTVRADNPQAFWDPGYVKMNNRRWYPTVVALANGNGFIIGGSDPFVDDNWNKTNGDYEYFDLSQNRLLRKDETNKSLPEDASFPWPPGDRRQHVADGKRLAGLYPLVHLLPNVPGDDAPNGLLFVLTESFVRIYNPDTNKIIGAKQDIGGFRTWWTQASSVLLPIEIDKAGNGPSVVRIMIFGGGTLGVGGDDGARAPALRTAEVWTYDINRRTIRRERTFELRRPRFMGDSILLPDGNIALVGGASTGYANNNSNRVLNAEIIQPNVGSSTDMAAATEKRGYHASALLLPDASVFVTGGTGYWKTEQFYEHPQSYPPRNTRPLRSSNLPT